MKAIVLIKMIVGENKPAYRDLKKIKGVQSVFLSFGPYDAIAIIEADELNQIGRMVEFEIQTIPEVIKTLTCLMVEAELPIPEHILDQQTEEIDDYLMESASRQVSTYL